MTMKGVKFNSANGKTVWAANDETTNQTLKDAESGQWISSNTVVVRTSGYARFANAILPEGAFDITGIFTRYNNVWQIILRNTDDLKPVVLDKSGTLDYGNATYSISVDGKVGEGKTLKE